MNYVSKCRSNYSPEKKKWINQYYCRSWTSWISRHVGTSIAEDRIKNRIGNITSDYIRNLAQKQNFCCCFSGVPLRHDKSLHSLSIDRIDNSLGHVIGNINITCRGINLAKNTGSSDDIILFLDNLINPNFIPDNFSRDYISSRVRSHSRRDAILGLDCDIDSDFIIDLLNKQNFCCYFSGIKLACYKHPTLSISIDRINNSLGHTTNNVRLVSKAVNRAKRNYSDYDFIEWLGDVKRYHDVY